MVWLSGRVVEDGDGVEEGEELGAGEGCVGRCFGGVFGFW